MARESAQFRLRVALAKALLTDCPHGEVTMRSAGHDCPDCSHDRYTWAQSLLDSLVEAAERATKSSGGA